MRKNLIAKQVEYFYKNLNLEVTEKIQGGNTYKVINNWFPISTALYKLNEYDFVGDSVQNIFNLGASFQSSSKSISILNAEYTGFVTKFNIVKAKCEAIIDSSSIGEDISDLYIKLPDKTPDLLEVSSILKDLDLSFNKCPIFSKEIGNISFKKVEEGSNWIVVEIGCAIVAGAKVLNWIANYVKTCNEIRLQNRSIKLAELDIILKEMEIEDKEQERKYKEKVRKAEDAKIKSFCLESFKNMEITTEKITPEQEGQIVNCMRTLADLLDMGVEIYPSQSSDVETRKLFPKQEEFKLLEDSQKLLEEPKNNN